METGSVTNSLIEHWVLFHSHQSQKSKPQKDDDDDIENLSLSDLVMNKPDGQIANHPEKQLFDKDDQDFDFLSTPPETKMCMADEVFFQGQIMPLEIYSGLNMTRSFFGSKSDLVRISSSRSSSTHSHNSGTSESSITAGSEFTRYKSKSQNRNMFHSHPSPRPHIHTRSFPQTNTKTSSKWSLLQLGPLKTQEIGLVDLKNRSRRRHNTSMKKDHNLVTEKKTTKKQTLLLGGCTCSTNVIESTMSSRNSMVKPTQETKLSTSKQGNVGQRKHALSESLSSHPTSQWLNQQSIRKNYSR
ncbi:hypothetical protein CTI12_AA237740 [Artemisia annua]|uniref:Uncharacterized protein n=1 Tax=Artemisia annua TaxID=35608 RepID=A0A2U1NQX6_ARTAN|nr:hypothetical protein CTI12_AA237740 [Artemisia annua]